MFGPVQLAVVVIVPVTANGNGSDIVTSPKSLSQIIDPDISLILTLCVPAETPTILKGLSAVIDQLTPPSIEYS